MIQLSVVPKVVNLSFCPSHIRVHTMFNPTRLIFFRRVLRVLNSSLDVIIIIESGSNLTSCITYICGTNWDCYLGHRSKVYSFNSRSLHFAGRVTTSRLSWYFSNPSLGFVYERGNPLLTDEWSLPSTSGHVTPGWVSSTTLQSTTHYRSKTYPLVPHRDPETHTLSRRLWRDRESWTWT